MWMMSGLRVLGVVAQAVDQDAAGDRAIGAGVAGFGRRRQLERPDRRGQRLARRAKAKSAETGCRQTGAGELDETATIQFQGTPRALWRRAITARLWSIRAGEGSTIRGTLIFFDPVQMARLNGM